MQMGPGLRRAALAVHVVSSVGWIGAAAAYLVLGVAAGISDDPETVRAAWIAMELIGRYGIVPISILALITGLIMSLGTPWGILRHYWVVIALVLTVVSLIVLIAHMPTVTATATLARTADDSTMAQLGGDVLHPALGLVVLTVVAVLNLYKPRGLTAYGRRQQAQARNRSRTNSMR
jgi:hypothetical protein